MDFFILLKPFLMDKTRIVGLKTWRFDEKRGGPIFHESNTFSDENVKIIYLNKKNICLAVYQR